MPIYPPPGVIIQEIDGSPSVRATTIKVSNGTLTDDGGGTVTIDTASGGALVFLEAHTASSSASLDFTTRNAPGQSGATFQSDFDDYRIEFVGVGPATNGAIPYIRFSTDGGATFDSSSIYDYAETHTGGGTVVGFGASTVSAGILFSDNVGAALSSTALPALAGSARLFDPGSVVNHKILDFLGSGVYSGNGNRYLVHSQNVYKSTTAVNAIRFLMSSGNIASGTIRIYGIAK